MALSLYIPGQGEPQLNQPTLVAYNVNGRWEVVEEKWVGNVPQGAQLISPQQAKTYTLQNATDLQSQIDWYARGGQTSARVIDPMKAAIAEMNAKATSYDRYQPPAPTGQQYVTGPTGNIMFEKDAASYISPEQGLAESQKKAVAMGGMTPEALAASNTANQAAGGITAASKPPVQTPQAPVDTNYQMIKGEGTDAYSARILAYNRAKDPASYVAPGSGPTYGAGGAITGAGLSGTTPINYKAGPTLSQTSTTLGLPFDVPQITATPEEDDLTKRINDLMGLNVKAGEKGAYTTEQNIAGDVAGKTRLVNDFSSQLKISQLEAANIQQEVQTGQGVTTAIDQRQRAEKLRLNSVKSLGIYAQLEMAKGNLATAQDAVDRAVSLKFDPIEGAIEAAKANIELLLKSPNMTRADKNRALLVQAQLEARSAAITQQKDNEKKVWDVYVEAVQNGLTDVTILNKIKNASTPEIALEIAAQAGFATKVTAPKIIGSASSGYYTVDAQGNTTPLNVSGNVPDGPISTGGYNFTSTQFNTGASKAALPLDTFKALAGDVQNFYIHLTTSQTTDISTLFSDVQSGKLTPEAAKANIEAKSMTPAVKEYLKARIDSLAPITTTGQKGFIANTWDTIKGWLGI
jgi:hypothetical protein